MQIVDHGTWQVAAADEDLHPVGPELLWNESYYFDFAAPDGSVGGYVRLGLYPNWDRAWYWACIVRPGQPAVLVADNAAPLPAPGGTDLQTAALNAAQEITEPLAAARIILDAMGTVLREPAAAYGDHGPANHGAADHGVSDHGAPADHVRLGLDLEWRTVGGVYPYKDLPRYEIPCQVSGTVRLGDQTLAISGWGERDHSWGERDWWRVSWLWSSGRLDDGTAFHGMQANIGFPIGWPSFRGHPGRRAQPPDRVRGGNLLWSGRVPSAVQVARAGRADAGGPAGVRPRRHDLARRPCQPLPACAVPVRRRRRSDRIRLDRVESAARLGGPWLVIPRGGRGGGAMSAAVGGASGLTAGFLTAALAGSLDGAIVEAVEAARVGTGQVSDTYRLLLTYSGPPDSSTAEVRSGHPKLPATLIAKVPAADTASRGAARAFRTYEIEASFYSQLAPGLPVALPACFYSAYDADPDEYVVLLADLAPARAGRPASWP